MTEINIHIANLLLTRIADGDEIAFKLLFHQYRNKIYTVLFAILHRHEEAERMLQHVFLEIWNNRETLPEVYSFNAYVDVVLCRCLHADCLPGNERAWLEKEMWIKAGGQIGEMESEALSRERAELLLARIQKKLKNDEARTRWKCFAAAAVITGLIGSGVLWFNNYYRSFHTYITQAGERKTFILPDGTKVKLNGGSVLRLVGGYGNKLREMDLKGEGYFEVKCDSACSFIVHTSAMDVKDAGTAFTVRAYPEECADVAAAIRGRVSVTLKSKSSDTAMYRLPAMQKLTVCKPMSANASDAGETPLIEQLSPNTSQGAPAEIAWIIER